MKGIEAPRVYAQDSQDSIYRKINLYQTRERDGDGFVWRVLGDHGVARKWGTGERERERSSFEIG